LEKSLRRLHKVDKNSNLENGVRVHMDNFNLVVIKESAEKIAGMEAKSVFKERREHHNLSRIECKKVFPGDRTPLQDNAVQEKVIHNKLADFTFIRDGWLEKMWVRGSHCRGKRSQRHGIRASAKVKIARNGGRGRND
jgi:hypothetical protein